MKLTRTLVITASLAALSLALVAGCNKAESSEPTPTTTSKGGADDLGDLVAYSNEKGELICPVLGDVIASADAAVGHQDYEGKRYYFCCAGCPEKFAADPEKYAK